MVNEVLENNVSNQEISCSIRDAELELKILSSKFPDKVKQQILSAPKKDREDLYKYSIEVAHKVAYLIGGDYMYE